MRHSARWHVTAGQKGYAGFFRNVRLRFGNFACDEGVHTLRNGRLEIRLRPTRAPSDALNGLVRGGHAGDVTCQHRLHMHGQCLCILKPLWAERLAYTNQILIATPSLGLQAKGFAQLCIVAQFGVCIEGQVVGVQIDVVRQQSLQAFLHPADHPAVLAAPEQAVVYKDGIGFGFDGRVNQLATGCDARDQFAHHGLAFNLQTIGSVIFEAFRLQQLVKRLKQRLEICHGNLI